MARVDAGNVLLVIQGFSINASESARRTQFQSWGHTVTTIQDSASQASFNTAVAAADCVYVPATVDGWELLYKLRTATCGVISEKFGLDTEFGFATANGYTQSSATLENTVNTHQVTAGLPSGNAVLFTSSQEIALNGNTPAAGMLVLGTYSWGQLGLGVIEAGGTLANTYNGNSTASGRRVRMPWANITWSSLNSNGRTLVQNALAWAGAGGQGLVGRWKLNETSGTTANDSSDMNNDGTYTGGVSLNQAGPYPGEAEVAAQFAGDNDYVSLGSINSDFTGGLTVALWARPTSNGSWARFMDIGNGAATDNIFFTRVGTSNDLRLDIQDGSLGASQTLTASDAIINNEWHHYAVTVDNSGNAKIYRDGQLLVSGTTGVPGNVTRSNNYIGRSNWSADAYYQGRMYDVRLYNMAVTSTEIAELYGLVGHWKLDETSGTTAADSSPMGKDGTYTGGVTLGGTGPDTGTSAAHFDGSNDHVVLPTYETDFSKGYSIGAWGRPTNSGYWARFLDMGGGEDVNNFFLSRYGTTTTLSSAIHDGSLGDQRIDATNAIVNDQWHHYLVTVDSSGEAKLYLDGVNIATSTIGVPSDATRNSNFIAKSNWAVDAYFRGKMSGVRLYNRPLSEEEIAKITSFTKLHAHWTFDEGSGTTIADESAGGNDASFDTGSPTWVSGPRAGALQFNGFNDADTNSNFDPPSTGSVAFWMKRDSSVTGTERLFGIQEDWEVRIVPGGIVYFDLSGDGADGFHTTASLDSPGRWYHVVAIYNSDTDSYAVYVDGTLMKTGSMSLDDKAAGILSFGTRTGSTERYRGALDDLRVYNYELTPEEIAELYGLVGHWKMDEGSGSTAADSTAFANDATLSGAIWTTDCSGNAALAFDGSGDTAATGASFDPPESGTVAFWMKSPGTPSSRQRLWGLGTNFETWQDSGGLLACDLLADGEDGGFITNEALNEESRWYHLVLQYDADTDSYAIYLNGELHKSGVSTQNLTPQTADILTFGTRTGSSEYWEGELRDFRVYNRWILDREIIELSATAGHWRLDETSGSNAADATLLANDGSYLNTPTLGVGSVYAPENGTAVSFNGNNECITIPHDDAMLADNGTVMFWFRGKSLSSDEGLFSKDSNNFDTGGHLTIRLLDGKIDVRFQSTTDSYTVESPVLAATKWRHVAFTWGFAGMKLYIDGQLADSESYTGGMGTTSGGAGNYEPIVLGASSDNSSNLSPTPINNFFSGALDDVRFYARAYCSEELYQVYRGGRSPGVRIIRWEEVR